MNRMKKMNALRLAAGTALALAIAWTVTALGDEASSRPTGLLMADLVRQYQADARCIQDAFHLPASTTALDKIERFQAAWLKRLRDTDFETLDRASKLDYLLLQNEIQRSIDDLAQQRKRLTEIERMIDFRETILDLEQARRQGAPIDSRAAAEKLAALAAKVKQLRGRINKTPLAVSPGLALR